LLEEQEALKKELEYQRYAVNQVKNRNQLSSRERELDALAMLDNYSKSVVKLNFETLNFLESG